MLLQHTTQLHKSFHWNGQTHTQPQTLGRPSLIETCTYGEFHVLIAEEIEFPAKLLATKETWENIKPYSNFRAICVILPFIFCLILVYYLQTKLEQQKEELQNGNLISLPYSTSRRKLKLLATLILIIFLTLFTFICCCYIVVYRSVLGITPMEIGKRGLFWNN